MESKYRHMLRRMQEKEKKARRKKKEAWFLYILECNDGSFYTGITKDLKQRVKRHNDGKGSSFTRVRRPVKIIYRESLFSRTQALVRECKVKALSRAQKEILVSTTKMGVRRSFRLDRVGKEVL